MQVRLLLSAITIMIVSLVAPPLVDAHVSGLQSTDEDVDEPADPPSTEEEDQLGDGLVGASDSAVPSFDATVTRTETWIASEPALDPLVDAAFAATNGGLIEALADIDATPPADNCVEYSEPEYNAEGDFYYSGFCIKWRVCGGERVDDVVSGNIAGRDATGKYREYLGEMTGYLASEATLPDGALDVNSVNDLLLSQGLGDQPDDDLIPVFYWCANQDQFGVFDPIDITSVRFGWDLTYDAVYDIPGVRSDLYIQLTSQLGLYNPQPGAVPPIDGGYTFAQWPTWFFLENPLEQEHIFTTNDIDTFRIDLRATLLRVDWTFGGNLVASCAPSDMKRYDANNDDPIDDLPPCHHIFGQVDTQDLGTTIVYEIHEKVRSRRSASLDEYPDIAWSPYLGTPTTVELSTTVDNYQIHEIVAVNVPNQ
jgi:hypothetical protein